MIIMVQYDAMSEYIRMMQYGTIDRTYWKGLDRTGRDLDSPRSMMSSVIRNDGIKECDGTC